MKSNEVFKDTFGYKYGREERGIGTFGRDDLPGSTGSTGTWFASHDDSPANQSAEIIDAGSHEENTDTGTVTRDDEGFRDYCEKLSYINHEALKVQK